MLELLKRLNSEGVLFQAEAGRLVVEGPEEVLTPDDVEAIRTHKAAILKLLTCQACGAGLSSEDLLKAGDCPRCRTTLPGWEDVPTPAAVLAVPADPDPGALRRGLERLQAELGPATEVELAETVRQAIGKRAQLGRWPWPFDELPQVELEALIAWTTAPQPQAPPGTQLSLELLKAPAEDRKTRLNLLADGCLKLAERLGYPELGPPLAPARVAGGRPAWEEAVKAAAKAGHEARLWAWLFGLEELASPEAERVATDQLLARAQELGYPEVSADNACPGPIRRIPPGPTAWVIAALSMTAAERKYWLMRLAG